MSDGGTAVTAPITRGSDWWDCWFLGLARYHASASKDPSTRVGAVIVRPDRIVVASGFNGFPRGIADTDARLADRPTKYQLVVHAEMNALLQAGWQAAGCTLYSWPLAPCERCAAHIAQAGIVRVVAPGVREDFAGTPAILGEAGVGFDIVSLVMAGGAKP